MPSPPLPDVGGYWVEVAALPRCNTQGDILDEAIAMAKGAIALYLEKLTTRGEPVPEEIGHPRLLSVDVAT